MTRPLLSPRDALSILMILEPNWRQSLRRDGFAKDIPRVKRAIEKLVKIEARSSTSATGNHD